jgi:NTE family protein
MFDQSPWQRKTHVAAERPPFERIALILQGGGALGSYQAGVYQALAEANLHPDWVAGISIGAINSALIAGNPAEKRVERLREFWEAITTPPFGIPDFYEPRGELARTLVNHASSLGALLGGAPEFFKPRVPPPYFYPDGTLEATSYYDVAPLRATLGRLVDFDLINAGVIRFSVGAVNVRSGNFVYFDNATHHIRPEHVIASGSLPPGFPPTEIEGEYYWDGGLVSNTPLQWVLDSVPRQDTLAFQVDLWSARGELPRKSDRIRDPPERDPLFQPHPDGHQRVLEKTAAALRRARSFGQAARRSAGIARGKNSRSGGGCEVLQSDPADLSRAEIRVNSKDYEFSRRTMEEHWRSGYNDAVRTLRHPEVLQRAQGMERVFTFDLAVDGRE